MLLGTPESTIEWTELEPGAQWVLRRLLTSVKSGWLVRRQRDQAMEPRNLTTELMPVFHAWAAGVHYLKGRVWVSDLSSWLFVHTSNELTQSRYRKTSEAL